MQGAGSSNAPIRRVVLLGMMGAGKTTVGRVLADRLGWEHLDLDREIEQRTGQRISDVFRVQGEAHFRRLEAELTREIAGLPRVVLSPGGGWITTPALLEGLGAGTLSVWLRVSPDEVLRRLGGGGDRPLLIRPDPRTVLEQLLREREPLYRQSDIELDTNHRGSEAIAAEIERIVRERGMVAGPEHT